DAPRPRDREPLAAALAVGDHAGHAARCQGGDAEQRRPGGDDLAGAAGGDADQVGEQVELVERDDEQPEDHREAAGEGPPEVGVVRRPQRPQERGDVEPGPGLGEGGPGPGGADGAAGGGSRCRGWSRVDRSRARTTKATPNATIVHGTRTIPAAGCSMAPAATKAPSAGPTRWAPGRGAG